MKILKFAASPLLGILGIANKQPKIPGAQPTVTRDDAIAAMAQQDELAKRRGGAADIITGSGGAEASGTGGKSTLGS